MFCPLKLVYASNFKNEIIYIKDIYFLVAYTSNQQKVYRLNWIFSNKSTCLHLETKGIKAK